MKRNVRRMLMVLGLVFPLLGAGVSVVLTIGRAPPPRVLPNPNGYDDLVNAGQAVKRNGGDTSALDIDELRALVAINAEPLRLLRLGLGRDCAVPTDATLLKFATLSSDLMVLKSLAEVLSAEGRLAEKENRLADAARSYVDTIRLGSAISQGGFLVNRLVGIACEGRGCIQLVKMFHQLNCEQMRPLVADLEAIDHRTVPWREVLGNENRYARSQMGNYPNPLKLASGLWRARGMRKTSEERHHLAAAHLRLAAVDLALRCYRCDQGRAPGSLSELVPKYLERLPTDPFGGDPLVYRPTGTIWLLYSLRPDLVDDRGKPVGKIMSGDYLFVLGVSISGKEEKKGDLHYDSPW